MEQPQTKKAKTEDTSSSESKIQLNVLPEVPVISCAQRPNFRFMASLKAPSFQSDKRAPLRIIAVIDISSSMVGQKLQLVKETLQFAISQLSSRDQLGIISYSNLVSVNCPLCDMDSVGKKMALEAVKSLIAHGATNLCGGLIEGLRWMHSYVSANISNNNNSNDNTTFVNSLLLFTDGCANVWRSTSEKILEAVDKYDRQIRFTRIISPQDSSKWKEALQKKPEMCSAFLQQIKARTTIVIPALITPAKTTVPPVAPLVPSPLPTVNAPVVITAPAPHADGKQQVGSSSPPPSPAPLPAPSPANNLATLPRECFPVITSPEVPPLPCTVHTFGFGTDHDAGMLQAIAEKGSGVYYYIEDASNIPEAFADCLGGLLSMVGQKITLQVFAADGVKIKQVLTEFPVKEIQKETAFEITVPDVQSDEQKDFPFVAEIPSCEGPIENYRIADISLTYHNLIIGSDTGVEATCSVNRNFAPVVSVSNVTAIDAQNNRIVAVQAMKQAAQLGMNGNLTQASSSINQAYQQIASSASAQDTFTKSLLTDLAKTQGMLQDQKTFQAVGTKTIMAQVVAHQAQRSSVATMVSQASYQTPARVTMQQAQQMMIPQQKPSPVVSINPQNKTNVTNQGK